ncbi:hypothetical protein [Dactylosporangium sp. CA-139066]|uniref:hypothetical protein n=1 Tax=Dactylosporangium sp. CA-139066 TaxID=3239930 RepID=UPI003D8EC18E
MHEHTTAVRSPGYIDARHGRPAATNVEHPRDVRAALAALAGCTARRRTSLERGRVR